jgi:hypothetical protein
MEMKWCSVGAISTSLLTAVTFLAALAVSYWSKDTSNLNLLIGAVIANTSTVVSFWLGSSAGSQRKDEILGARTA